MSDRLTREELDERALKAYTAADERGDAVGAYNLGVMLEQRGDDEGAEAAYRRADERGHAAGAAALGALLLRRGDQAGGEELLRRAAERGDAGAAQRLTDLLEQRGDAEAARRLLQDIENRLDREERGGRRQRVPLLAVWAAVTALALLVELLLAVNGTVGWLDLLALAIVLGLIGGLLASQTRTQLLAFPVPIAVGMGIVLWIWDFEPWFAVVFAILLAAGAWAAPRLIRRVLGQP